MIDIFSIALTHGLIVLAAWQLLARDELDEEPPGGPEDDEGAPASPPAKTRPWLANQKYLNSDDPHA